MKKIFFAVFILSGLLFLLSEARAVDFSDVVEFRVDNPFYSPNGDGLQDNLFFTSVLKSEWDVSRWRLEIFSSRSKKLVQKMTGAGFPTLIQWNGKDRKENNLEEGAYEAVLSLWGPGFKIKSDPKTVWIDNMPPTVDLILSTGTSEGLYSFLPSAQDSGGIDRWQFQILGVTGKTIDVEWSSGPVTSVSWDGHDRATGLTVPPGPYKAVFQAWDKAGNSSNPTFLDFSVKVAVNQEVKELLKDVHPVATPLGLLVQFDAKKIFYFSKGKPQLSKQGLAYLSETALLINSYPLASIRVDGYSFSPGQSPKDRDISSLYAWSVYSYFVKQGNVKASRLTVRGRGRVAPEDRIRSKPPYEINGIEVILLGQGSL